MWIRAPQDVHVGRGGEGGLGARVVMRDAWCVSFLFCVRFNTSLTLRMRVIFSRETWDRESELGGVRQ